MNEAEVNKSSESSGSAMDIVSMAFSNVSENSDLMEVVNAVSQPDMPDDQVTRGDMGDGVTDEHVVRCVENQPADVPNQNGQDHSGQIEIPLPPNAIITVNEQGEQIIELAQHAQVVGEDPDVQTCLIDNCVVEHVEQIEQVETLINHETPPGPSGDVPMSVGEGDGLEAMTFQGQNVGMVGGEPCVVPVTISLTDVQNLQQAVSGGETAHVSSVDEVTSSTCRQPASASSLFGSLANIINTSSVVTTSNSSLPAACMAGVTFVSAAGVPIQAVPNVRNSAESQTILSTGTSAASTAQFIHNGTNLQQINFNESVLMPHKSQLMNSTQVTSMGGGTVINANQVQSLPQLHKPDSANVIGNRSVFSPMTLTIRTPPGAPAVNQALINSIVNNTEVQALLKRNPGQPITIVRVPEDPLERRNNPGVVTAKVVTSSAGSTIPHRAGLGRPRKEHAAAGINPIARSFTGRRRGRQPGTKLRRKEEEYVAPVSWQPVKSRTRSGRISRPPGYRTENFKMLHFVERSDNQVSDAECSSDVEPDGSSRVSLTLSGRVKKFKCRSCSKAYIGRGGLARHFGVKPTHGNINDYDPSDGVLPKPGGSTPEEVQNKPDGLAESEINNKETTESEPESSKPLIQPEGESPVSLKEDSVIDLDNEPDTVETSSETPSKEPKAEPKAEPVVTGRRGRPPGVRQSNSTKDTKDDPDFRPGMPTNKVNVKSKERRKETMKQALKFLNNEDYMDVCLPRVVRNISLWDFLISKAELDKEDTSQVLKVLQLFEELLSDVREMAVNCLEKVDDEDMQSEGMYLDEDDDLARVLEFDKGWYNVSEPPPGAVSLPYSVASLLKRPVEFVGKDDQVDEEAIPIKRRKVDDDQLVASQQTLQGPSNSKMKPMPKLGAITDPKSITVHVHGRKVTTEQGSPSAAALRSPRQENRLSPLKADQEPLATSNSRNEQTSLDQVTQETPLPTQQAFEPSSNPVIQLSPEKQPVTSLDPEKQPVTPLDPEKQPVTPLDPEQQPVTLQDPEQQLVTPLDPEQQPVTPLDPEQQPVTPLDPEQQPVTPLDPEQQPVTSLDPEQQSVNPRDPEKPSETTPLESSGEDPPVAGGDLQETRNSSPLPLLGTELDPPQEDTVGGQPDAWSVEDVPGPSNMGTQFVQAAEELASLAASADVSQSDEVEQPDPIHQEDTSVVVPEGSTIMQMQDGTFLVQRPDGTAMQIHTPEGMTIETVQELLSMEAGQG